jgi:hypothetical protein
MRQTTQTSTEFSVMAYTDQQPGVVREFRGWTRFTGKIVPGYQVASGRGGDPLFPPGTIQMQIPHFKQRGMDLSSYFHGTLNVNIAPLRYEVRFPKLTLWHVQWHPTEPAEDFSFFDVQLIQPKGKIDGLVYYPHPETKPKHFQKPQVLELLLPFVPGLAYGDLIELGVRPQQMGINSDVPQ